MSRTLLLVSCVASLAAADKDLLYTSDCAVLDICGGREMCCLAGKMDKKQGTCTYTDGTSCYLCTPVDGLAKCGQTSVKTLGYAAGLEGTVTLTAGQVLAGGSGAGNGLPITTPNSGITLTIGTYEGMAGWLDIEESRFYDFSEFFLGIVATIPTFYTTAGFRVVYNCNSAGLPGVVPKDFKGCNIFLFVYSCPPCNSHSGNIGAQLLAMETPTWYAGNCGPTFKLNKDLGVKHPFLAYTAEVYDNTETTVQLENDVQFMFWAVVGKSVVCQSKETEAECKAFPINCVWTEDGCRWRDCTPASPFTGPLNPRCTVCVDDEEEFIPEVLFTP